MQTLPHSLDFGPGNSLLGSNEVDSKVVDEAIFNVSSNLLPANFDTASFLTPEIPKLRVPRTAEPPSYKGNNNARPKLRLSIGRTGVTMLKTIGVVDGIYYLFTYARLPS
jgi:hypothetical protein